MGCAVPGYPTVYARVSEFMPWIKHVIMGQPMPTTTPPPTTVPPTNETMFGNSTNTLWNIFRFSENTTDVSSMNSSHSLLDNSTDLFPTTNVINTTYPDGMNITDTDEKLVP